MNTIRAAITFPPKHIQQRKSDEYKHSLKCGTLLHGAHINEALTGLGLTFV